MSYNTTLSHRLHLRNDTKTLYGQKCIQFNGIHSVQFSFVTQVIHFC